MTLCRCAQCMGTAEPEPEEETCADGRCGECASCIASDEADRSDLEYERKRDREMEQVEKDKEEK